MRINTEEDSNSIFTGYDLCIGLLQQKGADLIADGLVDAADCKETDWLEFKAACAPPSPCPDGALSADDYRWHIARAALALANTYGGAILLGVNDEGEPIGLEGCDPKKLLSRNDQGTDAFIRHLDRTIFKPSHGWKCNKSGSITLSDEPPHDLVDIRLGTLRSKNIVIVLVKPRPFSEAQDGSVLPVKYECIHCVEEHDNKDREFVPVRTIGAVGEVRCLARSAQWNQWEIKRSECPLHYKMVYEEWLNELKLDTISLEGEWEGYYIENKTYTDFRLQIRKQTRNGDSLKIQGTCKEPARGRRFAGRHCDFINAEISGTYSATEEKLEFSKTYQGNSDHTINYIGFPTSAHEFSGDWMNTPGIIPRRRSGNFVMRRAGDHFNQSKPVFLITGFEPFGKATENPSWTIAEVICNQFYSSIPASLHSCLLPVGNHAEGIDAQRNLRQKLDELKPDVCLCLGMARKRICHIERRARKPPEFIDAENSNMSGAWPPEELIKEFKSLKLPFRFSNEAGEYVCEATYWALLDYAKTNTKPHFTIFIHVPRNMSRRKIQITTLAISNILRIRAEKMNSK